ncbi:unnamed protein product [Adineta ricciae]|uniref:NAD(P)(+)--arginine ADP-ribosyltransferase n=1 Tax=Adineta ricciae TaxID=249248 RepID=A0A813Y8G4_ADIRI|nr:unnamed protein product [Adineta ricciae]
MATSAVEKNKHMINRILKELSDPTCNLPRIEGYENERITTLEKAVQPIIPFVPDVMEMVSLVKVKCQQPKDNLSIDEGSAIMLYTFEEPYLKPSFFGVLNDKLRTANRQELRPWFLYLRLVIHALAKLPSTTCRMIYRAVNKDLGDQYPQGKLVTWWPFSSCTTTVHVLTTFLGENGAGTIFNIECDSGKSVSQHSYFDSENEILLYPARQFQVLSSVKTGGQNRIIQLREVQPRPPLIQIPKALSASSIQQNERLRAKIQQLENRSKIDLSSQNLTDDDVYIIVECIVEKRQCKWLYLEKNNITSMGASTLAKALSHDKTLEWLDISHNRLDDEGVHAFTEALSSNNSKLKALHLWSVGLTNKGIEYITEMLRTNTRLTHLGLAENRITEVGIQCLTNVLTYRNSTLIELDLSHTKSINDSSIDLFIEMFKGNRSLTVLNLEKCNLSSGGKAKLLESVKSKENFNLIL